jgi:CubicO group peptidase (beta-lactamase class C family)
MRQRRRPLLALQLFILGACGGSAPVAPAPKPTLPVAKPAIIAPVRLAPVTELVGATPAAVGMDSALNARIDSIVEVALREGAAPGAAVAIGRHGRLVHLKGYGTVDYSPGAAAVTPATLFDLASLTKVVATTTVAMMLEEKGRLDLARPVHFYVPEFDAPDKAAITVGMLLTHTGGLEAYAPLHLQHRGRAAYLAQINSRPLKSVPGSAMVYSDWDMVLLQAVIERITGFPLDGLATDWIFRPLGMQDTRFLPDTSDTALRSRIAVTAVDTARGGPLQGTVHDGNAWALGGVSGHAGLFSSARELATFSQLLLDGGTYGSRRYLLPSTVTRWTARQTAAWSRALGWDTPAASSSAGRYFSPRSFGHTGFTGTSIWIDPERGLFVVLLTNRVNSRGTSTRHVQLRRDVADAAQAAILDAPLVDWEQLTRTP